MSVILGVSIPKTQAQAGYSILAADTASTENNTRCYVATSKIIEVGEDLAIAHAGFSRVANVIQENAGKLWRARKTRNNAIGAIVHKLREVLIGDGFRAETEHHGNSFPHISLIVALAGEVYGIGADFAYAPQQGLHPVGYGTGGEYAVGAFDGCRIRGGFDDGKILPAESAVREWTKIAISVAIKNTVTCDGGVDIWTSHEGVRCREPRYMAPVVHFH